jgi:hypothetical protein
VKVTHDYLMLPLWSAFLRPILRPRRPSPEHAEK